MTAQKRPLAPQQSGQSATAIATNHPNFLVRQAPSEAGAFPGAPAHLAHVLTCEYVENSLDIARDLVKAGTPVFVAKRCPEGCHFTGHTPGDGHGGSGFHFPTGWQATKADLANLDAWQPGDALALVGGHIADVVDVDPRNGGQESYNALRAAGAWPEAYGRQRTPSGGFHELIAPLGVEKGVPASGIDVQAGSPDGTGRGFAFIAPTVKVAKAGPQAGEFVPYVWEQAPDLDKLADSVETDESGREIRELIRARTVKVDKHTGELRTREGGRMPAWGMAGEEWTPERARKFVEPALEKVRNAPEGTINLAVNEAALCVGHFVPENLIPLAEAKRLITEAALENGRRAAARGEHGYDGKTWKVGTRMLSGLADGMAQPARRKAVRDNLEAVRDSMDSTGQGGLLGGQEEKPKPSRLRNALLRRSELGSLPEPVPLIAGVLHRETIAVLAGKFGSYKSFVTVGMGCSLAAGVPWMGYEVPAAVPVLYVAAEGASGIRKRVDAWERAHGPVPDSFYLLPVAARLLHDEDLAEIDELVGEFGIGVLIVDTLHASAPGADEDKSKEIGPLYDRLRGLRERHGLTTLLVHHTGHAGERARGSSAIEDDADTSFVIKLEGDERGPDTPRTLHHRKAKDGELIPPMGLALELVEGTGSGYVTAKEAPACGKLTGAAAVRALVAVMDECNVPASYGRDAARDFVLRLRPDVKAGNKTWADAVRERKSNAGVRPAGMDIPDPFA